MKELENELHHILEDFANSRANDYELHQPTEHTYWHSIAAIEKAFKKYGYVRKEDVADDLRKVMPGILKKRLPEFGFMTGQEWYGRFNDELNTAINKGGQQFYISPNVEWVRECARRASGIDNQ